MVSSQMLIDLNFVISRVRMPQELFSTMTINLIGLCDRAFPSWHNWQNDLLLRSRRYQDQVVMLLPTIQQANSNDLNGLLQRIAFFLRQERKYQKASTLITKAVCDSQRDKRERTSRYTSSNGQLSIDVS